VHVAPELRRVNLLLHLHGRCHLEFELNFLQSQLHLTRVVLQNWC
jgi:hypothetical protein